MNTKSVPAVVNCLNNLDKEALIRRLLLYTAGIVKVRYPSWRDRLPSGSESQDIVSTAMEKTLNGTRHWNQVKNPDMFDHLASVIDSELSNLWHLKETQTTARVNPDIKRDLDEHDGLAYINDLTTVDDPANQDVERFVSEKQQREVVFKWIDTAGDDSSILKMAQLILDDGLFNNEEIAHALNFTASQVKAKRTKLRWLLERYCSGYVNLSAMKFSLSLDRKVLNVFASDNEAIAHYRQEQKEIEKQKQTQAPKSSYYGHDGYLIRVFPQPGNFPDELSFVSLPRSPLSERLLDRISEDTKIVARRPFDSVPTVAKLLGSYQRKTTTKSARVKSS